MTDEQTITTAKVTGKLLGITPEEAYAAGKLLAAFEVFKKLPGGDEWRALRRAMLVYQQAKLYSRKTYGAIDADDVDEAIVQATIGESVDEALEGE